MNPSMTRRKPCKSCQNQGRLFPLRQAHRDLGYWMGGSRRIGGVTLIWALMRNCGNQSFRCQGRSSSGRSREARVPKRSTGTDRPVRVMKAGNAARAKGASQTAVVCVQLATGGEA